MKIITTEVLIRRQIEVPIITGVYDPLSRKYDGTITSQAPVVVSGRHLDMLNSDHISLCLAPATDSEQVVNVLEVYKLTHSQVIASLPFLIPGEYFPAVKIRKRGQEEYLYIFPVSWIVPPDGGDRRIFYSCSTDFIK